MRSLSFSRPSRPLVPLACALSIGCLLGSHSTEVVTVALCAICFVACVVLAYLLRAFPLVSLVLALLASTSLGASMAGGATLRARDITVSVGSSAPVVCEGGVEGAPRRKGWGASFDMRLVSCGPFGGPMEPARGGLRVNARAVPDDLAPGDLVRLPMVVKRPRSFDNPGAFDYRRYLTSNGIAAIGSARGPVEILSRAGRGLFHGARSLIDEAMEDGLPPEERPVVRALALGDRSGIDDDLREAFSRAGLAHLLALSGLHVGYVALMIYLLVRCTLGLVPPLVSRLPLRTLAAVVTVPAVWLYVAFTGLQVSAVRAAVMLTVYLAGVVLMRRPEIFSTIAVAAIAILIVDPLSVLSVSFQLSMAAVLGIALLGLPLMRMMHIEVSRGGLVRRGASWLAAIAVVSFAAGLGTAPLVAYHFKAATAAGPIANVVAVPLAGLALQPAVIVAELATLAQAPFAQSLWQWAGALAHALISVARFAADAGSMLVVRWAPTSAELCMSYAVMLAALAWRSLPWRRVVICSLAILVLTDLAYYRALPLVDDRLRVTFFDVGQGDAALVRFPGGRTLIIDGGGIRGSSVDVGREVLAPALLAMGVRRVDLALLTHPHYDHYAGLGHIAGEFGLDLIWTNGLAAPEKEIEQWGEFVAAASNVPTVEVTGEGVSREIGGATLSILPPLEAEPADCNDASLVAWIDYGRRRFPFAADPAHEGESLLLSKGIDLKSDVLKVGHHGSSDASKMEFLEAVDPEVAVISAGEGNPYGVPHDEALARLAHSGARILRTDIHGAVTVSTDGSDLKVDSCRDDPDG